jgi:hypothetical protein
MAGRLGKADRSDISVHVLDAAEEDDSAQAMAMAPLTGAHHLLVACFSYFPRRAIPSHIFLPILIHI